MVIAFVFIFRGQKYKKKIDVRNPFSLHYSGWDPERRNVIIIHGFNGTESKTPMTFIRDGMQERSIFSANAN